MGILTRANMPCPAPQQLAFSQHPRRLGLGTVTSSDSPKASSAPRPIADSSDWSDDDSDYSTGYSAGYSTGYSTDYNTGQSTGSAERSTSIAVSSFYAERQIEPCSMHYARQHQHYRTNARRLGLCGMTDELERDHQSFETGGGGRVDHNACRVGASKEWSSIDSELKKNPKKQLEEERCEQLVLNPTSLTDGCDQGVSMLDTSDPTPRPANGSNDHDAPVDELLDTVTQAKIAVEDARVRFNGAQSADDSLVAWEQLLAARNRLDQVTTSTLRTAYTEEDSESKAHKPTLTGLDLEEIVHREMGEFSPEIGAPRCLTYWTRRREKVEASRRLRGSEAAKEQSFDWADNSDEQREAEFEIIKTSTEHANSAGIETSSDNTFLIFGFEP